MTDPASTSAPADSPTGPQTPRSATARRRPRSLLVAAAVLGALAVGGAGSAAVGHALADVGDRGGVHEVAGHGGHHRPGDVDGADSPAAPNTGGSGTGGAAVPST